MTASPVALFVYNRLFHAKKAIASLLRNSLASSTDLIIYSDGPRNEKDLDQIKNVRQFLSTIVGFKSITIIHSEKNLGLSASVIHGVTESLQKYDKIIVLEDDLVVSPFFLVYMNDALSRYQDHEGVASIHGYTYPTDSALPETFFMPGADCWGWATWRGAWSLFNHDAEQLYNDLKESGKINEFSFNGHSNHSKILLQQVRGRIDSWAIRWHASVFMADKLTLYPGHSLIQNIGNDGSGTHCGNYNSHDINLYEQQVSVDEIEVKVSKAGYEAFEDFFRKSKESIFRKIIRKVF